MAFGHLPGDLAATGRAPRTPGRSQFDIPLREPLVPDPRAGRRRDPARTPGRQAVDLHPPVAFDQPLEIDLTPTPS